MDDRMDDMVRGLIVRPVKKREKEDIKNILFTPFLMLFNSIEENYEKIS